MLRPRIKRKAGRPFGTYKHGIPIQQYHALQRKILSELKAKERLLNNVKHYRLSFSLTAEELKQFNGLKEMRETNRSLLLRLMGAYDKSKT